MGIPPPPQPAENGPLNPVAIAQAQDKKDQSGQPDERHRPYRDREGGAPQRAGKQQAPGPRQQHNERKAPHGQVGQPGQDAQYVVREKGKQKGQNQEYRGLLLNQVLVLFRQVAADHPVGKVPSQGPGQPEHQHRAADHRGKGEQKGDPGTEQQPARCRADIAGDRRQHHGQQLKQEEAQVGVGGKTVDIGPQFLCGGGAEEAAAVQKPQPAQAQQQGGSQEQAAFFLCGCGQAFL